MENRAFLSLTEEEKDKFISILTPELVLLRTKAGISQEEIAALIGVSRQTYGAIERKTRKMSWSTFMALIMFYDYNQKTHKMIHTIGAFPYDIIKRFNNGDELYEGNDISFIDEGMTDILESLDEQALSSIRTMIMVEYARCTNTPGDVIVKSFDGRRFNLIPSKQTDDLRVADALKRIKDSRRKQK